MIDTLDFTDLRTLLTSFLLLFLIVFFRYIILSGTYHWLFFVVYRKRFRDRILSTQNQNVKQIKRELLLSVWSSVIFSIIGLLLLVLWQKGYTKIYLDVFEYSLWYFPCSIMIFLLLHDSYYYWLHVWMHSSKRIRRFHMDHHRSVDTNVFTSFSFHPLESLLQSLIIPLLFIIVPMSVIAVIIVLSIMTLSAIINHAGVEVYPIKKRFKGFSKYIIGATHHDYHHRNTKKNFGLYFTLWDRIMKTERK